MYVYALIVGFHTLMRLADPLCLLVRGSSAVTTSLNAHILAKVVASLTIRFNGNVPGILTAQMVRNIIEPNVCKWVELRILAAGNSIATAGTDLSTEGGRDRSVIRVRPLTEQWAKSC